MKRNWQRGGLAALGGAALAFGTACTSVGSPGERPAPEPDSTIRDLAAGEARTDRAAPPSEVAPPSGALPPVAVVELFTSEGCSSCPPADDILRDLSAQARDGGARVFTLSFHVDYWNDLGWPDPFSDPGYTARQRAYRNVLGGSGIYTPQMIVGGRDGFVGSDRAHARRSIAKALTVAATAEITLRAEAASDGARVRYAVAGAPAEGVLNIALVQSGVVSHVPRGENAGRTLRHEGVVRAFRSVALDSAASGEVTLRLPRGAAPADLSAIGYVQRPTFEVVGATRASIEAS